MILRQINSAPDITHYENEAAFSRSREDVFVRRREEPQEAYNGTYSPIDRFGSPFWRRRFLSWSCVSLLRRGPQPDRGDHCFDHSVQRLKVRASQKPISGGRS